MVHSCHVCINLSCLRSSGFSLMLCSGHIACTKLHLVFMKYLNVLIINLRYMAASRHTHNFRKCSHTTVGLAQARPIIISFILLLILSSFYISIFAIRNLHAVLLYSWCWKKKVRYGRFVGPNQQFCSWVLSKAGLSGSKEGFNDWVKEGSYNVIGDHLNKIFFIFSDLCH